MFVIYKWITNILILSGKGKQKVFPVFDLIRALCARLFQNLKYPFYSVDPDQLAADESSLSEFTLFCINTMNQHYPFSDQSNFHKARCNIKSLDGPLYIVQVKIFKTYCISFSEDHFSLSKQHRP